MSGAEGDVSDFSPSIQNSPTFMRRFHQQRLDDLHERERELTEIVALFHAKLCHVQTQIQSQEEKLCDTEKHNDVEELR